MVSRTDSFKVVINHEEQYSMIPATQKPTAGWREVGKVGSQNVCMNYIEQVWTGMRSSDKEKILKSIRG